MGLFSRNKQITSDEYEALAAKIVALKTDVQLALKDIEALKTNMHSVRGLINRKLGKKSFEEVEEEDEEQPMSEQEQLAEMQRAIMGLGNR